MQVVDLNEIETQPAGEARGGRLSGAQRDGHGRQRNRLIALEPAARCLSTPDSARSSWSSCGGEVEASVDGETGMLRSGQLAVVPPMAPHALRNVGSGDARVLGFFAASAVISTFAAPMGPEGAQVFVTGAPLASRSGSRTPLR